MQYKKIGEHSHFCHFNDIMDFVEYCEIVPDYNTSKSNCDDEWCGGSFAEAVEQAKRGNPELVKSMFDGANVISAMIEKEKIGEVRDVTGEYFDVADFLSGEPEVFRRNEYGDRKPVVPVYANFSMSCGVSTRVIMNRGCAIVALCDELSNCGFIVDLHLVHACEGGRSDFGDEFRGNHYTDIKVGTDPLDLDTAAFIIANPLCLRRLHFAMMERLINRADCGCYGSPIEYDLSDVFEQGVSGFYFVSSTHRSFESRNFKLLENAKNHIIEMVEKFKESAEQVILG